MNYDAEITKLVEAIKADKNLTQPWRNYALKYANELQMAVRMAATTAPQWLREAPIGPASTSCSCIPGGVANPNCSVHGIPSA